MQFYNILLYANFGCVGINIFFCSLGKFVNTHIVDKKIKKITKYRTTLVESGKIALFFNTRIQLS